MEHLWAPWRNAYVTGTSPEKNEKLFFNIGQSNEDAAHLVFLRSKSVFAVLNRYPYNAGHTLVAPYREVGDIRLLSNDEASDLWSTVNRVISLLESAFHPHGFNIGINQGRAAGAGLPSHLHVHIVPRWEHDSNFMTAQAETRIHPAELSTIYNKLSDLVAASRA
ncbi:MAG: HIT domain-containing protein [Candidatus Methylacidiphilales bacterium]